MRKIFLKFLALFKAPDGIPPSLNRKERRTRDSVARKQVNKRGLRYEQNDQQL